MLLLESLADRYPRFCSNHGHSSSMIGSLSSDSTASAADTDHDDETDEAAVKQELKEVSPRPRPAAS